MSRKQGGENVLRLLDGHLAERHYFVGDRYTVADIAMYAYMHVADEAGIDMSPYESVSSWLDRVEREPRYMHDLQPYPPNAGHGGRSIYDSET
jgi:glutathione S-transferase